MIEFLRTWMINIVTAVIFIIIVEMLITNDKFKKYVKLATGLVLMIIIINPIVTLVNKNFSLDSLAIQNFNDFEQKDIQSQALQLDDIKNAQIANLFKQNLTEQIKEQILHIDGITEVQVSVEIDEDPKSKSFGEIHKIDITSIKSGQKLDDAKSIKKVDIDISKNEETVSSKVAEKVKEKLSNVYGISNEKIYIKIPMKGE